MFLKPHSSSGVPIYLQLMEQIRHAVETGALRPGDQLPGMRTLAEQLVMNPNTVAKAYRELEHEGVIELRHGAGAYVSARAGPSAPPKALQTAKRMVADVIGRLQEAGHSEEEIRRLFESELARLRHETQTAR